ncbi:hypothetical protein QTO34_018160 [Cnephaeus nilssonii]|uniref:Reverse transcriptase domain-containing protein n=1 Tax=Cnephaeus nilssonii TaxID=3371016 RepID=A0AA40HYC5_CNENI|nr:hypothetical protein QTO34_018160 [Eptesicus nilssonii]
MPVSVEHPFAPVMKPGTNDYCLAQDLRVINEAIVTLHSALPNPYTLLVLIPFEAGWFTSSNSQPLFAFEWENPITGTKEQFTWTIFPQGFKNSPILFSGALAPDLARFLEWDLECVLLQYVDDLLLASST